ncbi:MAG: protein kinase [Planctomycetes bacterium]|nr:protein kinase [Planctomycetota bacterium]
MKEQGPGSRLERALEAFLQAAPRDDADAARLLEQHPDLHDLLQPMLHDRLEPAVADERVLGDFRLIRELGSGGMGVVYEAWQRSLDRRVAVKVLAPALVADAAALARFRREAAAAGRLRHPNIVEVYGFGSAAERHFFAMQFVAGEPLQACRQRFRDPPRAVALVERLLDALAHAHDHGLVHRDVKPANVLIHGDQPLLTDFGVASDDSAPTITRAGGFLGTLDYAAPEQVRGDPVDARADVWAVGVVLFELLTGERPFAATTQQATLQTILTAEPPTLRGRPGISDDLAAVVARALEKTPDRRYATAAAMRADLLAWQRGAPVSARLPTRLERTLRWARREPWRATALVLVLLGLPALTAALGYLVANAPRIAAATAAERTTAREEALAEAWAWANEGVPENGLATLATLDDATDEEVLASRALLLTMADRRDEARALLGTRTGPLVALVRHYLTSQGTDPPATAGAADDDAFASFVRAQILLENDFDSDAIDRTRLQQALAAAELAVNLSPAPRLSYLITLVRTADLVGDRERLRVGERALARHFPGSPAALRRRAQALVKLAPARALELLQDATPHGRSLPYFHLLRGVALEALGRLDEAEAANRAALAIEPRYERGWVNLGAVLRKQKRHAESAAALRQALTLRPGNASDWNHLGLTQKAMRDLDGARQSFGKALELRPRYSAAAFNLGNLEMQRGEAAAAVDCFARAVAADPANVRALGNLGDALQRAGRGQEALLASLRAALAAPGDLVPNFNVASTALELGLAQLALPFAEKAREIDGKGANGLFIHAKALLAQPTPDVPTALQEAREADRRSKAPDVDIRLLLARALATDGQGDAAATLLRDSLRTASWSPADRTRVDTALRELQERQPPR